MVALSVMFGGLNYSTNRTVVRLLPVIFNRLLTSRVLGSRFQTIDSATRPSNSEITVRHVRVCHPLKRSEKRW